MTSGGRAAIALGAVAAAALPGRTSTAASGRAEKTAIPDAAKIVQGPPSYELPGVSEIDQSCFSDTICRLRPRIRWGRGRPWSDEFCHTIAGGILDAADDYALHPALVLAVAINESDLMAEAVLTVEREDEIYAKDGGLMGIRCVLGRRGRCRNGHVRGMPWREVMDPLTNIRLGAEQLAYYRDGGGAETIVRRIRRRNGDVVTRKRRISCRHRNHAYWAHYNHGVEYISRGFPRHYPHRVAVLYRAIVDGLELPVPAELEDPHITVRDPGKRRRTSDRPLGSRYRRLARLIKDSAACPSIAATTPVPSGAHSLCRRGGRTCPPEARRPGQRMCAFADTSPRGWRPMARRLQNWMQM